MMRLAGMIREGHAYGSLEGGRGAGRARRRLSVISGQKNDVNVNSTGSCESRARGGKESQI